MRNNALITARDIYTFKEYITMRIDQHCKDMSPEDVSKLLEILYKEVDGFCLNCFTLCVDAEDKRDFRRGIKNNDK